MMVLEGWKLLEKAFLTDCGFNDSVDYGGSASWFCVLEDVHRPSLFEMKPLEVLINIQSK